MTEPKFKKPVKEAGTWPGLFEIRYSQGGPIERLEYRCPAPLCFYCIHIPQSRMSMADNLIENHPCPWYGGGTTTFSWSIMGSSYIEPIWEKLDAEVDIIKGLHRDGKTDDEIRADMQTARYRARGLAEALAILMVPFFTTGDEIVREAVVRHEKRVASEDYCTPGIGRLRWKRPDLSYDPSNPSWLPEHDPAQPTKRSAPKHNLSDEDIAKIKASASFPPKMLASAYNTTEDVIKYLLEN